MSLGGKTTDVAISGEGEYDVPGTSYVLYSLFLTDGAYEL